MSPTARRQPTPFEAAVYRVVRRIPKGQTRSYRWVAEQLGDPGLARAVGNALNRNPYATEAGTTASGRGRRRKCRWPRGHRPPEVPCHRVIKSDGSVGGFARGTRSKRRRLQLEGAL